MLQYRFYFLQADGCVFDAKERTLKDDLSALKLALVLSADSSIEVWQSDRMVICVKKGDEPLAAINRASLAQDHPKP